jgi:hypothetical protein
MHETDHNLHLCKLVGHHDDNSLKHQHTQGFRKDIVLFKMNKNIK